MRPEWLRSASNIWGQWRRKAEDNSTVVMFAVLALLLFVFFVTPPSVEPRASKDAPRESYLISVDRILLFDGSEALLLSYSVDGMIQSHPFPNQKRLEEFLAHLHRLGPVSSGPEGIPGAR